MITFGGAWGAISARVIGPEQSPERSLEDAKIAARTIALDATLDDAWDAGLHVLLCGAGWAQREITKLAEQVGPTPPPGRSHGLNLVMEAQWMQLSRELEGRALAAIGSKAS